MTGISSKWGVIFLGGANGQRCACLPVGRSLAQQSRSSAQRRQIGMLANPHRTIGEGDFDAAQRARPIADDVPLPRPLPRPSVYRRPRSEAGAHRPWGTNRRGSASAT
jgi:hypothetical protein